MGDLLSAQYQPLAAQAWGLCMRGRIISREKCPACGQSGKYSEQPYGLVCACGRYQARRPELEVIHQRRRLRISHDQKGQRFATYEHARRALGLIRNQIEEKSFYPETWASNRSNVFLFENYVAAWLEAEKDRLPYSSFITRENLCRHLAWLHGQNLKELRNAHLEDYTRHLAKSGLGIVSQQNVLRNLRVLLARAYRRGDIERPLQVQLPKAPHRAPRHLTAEQQLEVLRHIPEADRPIFTFMMQYGCRVGEAVALCWDMVDLARGHFLVARTYSMDRWSETTKTRRDRPMPILGWFASWLSQQVPGIGATVVFKNSRAQTGRRNYQQTALRRIWQHALEVAGLEHIPLKNGTRHSLGYALRRAGADMAGIARVLGHTETRTTRIYVEDDVALTASIMQNLERGHVVQLGADQMLTNGQTGQKKINNK